MITTAAITVIERIRDSCLPGREAVEVGDLWSTLTRSIPDVRNGRERRVIVDRQRRAAIHVRVPVRRG